MTVTIRPIRREDREQWLDLWCGDVSYLEFYESRDKVSTEATNTTFERFFEESEPVWAAVAVDDDGTLIGLAHYLRHRNTWSVTDSMYLNDLFVSPKSRQHGVGRKLIEYVYAEADKLGCKKTYWCTLPDNHRAQLLYTKVAKLTKVVYQR